MLNRPLFHQKGAMEYTRYKGLMANFYQTGKSIAQTTSISDMTYRPGFIPNLFGVPGVSKLASWRYYYCEVAG